MKVLYFQDLYTTCKAMQERIVELLAKLSDGELTEQLLLVNDDLNNLFLRLALTLLNSLNILKSITYIYKFMFF